METYFIGHSHERLLRPAAESEREHAAITRLTDFRGDLADVRTAAGIYERMGEGANAADLVRSTTGRMCHRCLDDLRLDDGTWCRECVEEAPA